MTMLTWDQFMAHVLRVLHDGQTRRLRDLYTLVADAAQLTEADRAERLPSGQFRFENRIGWACSYLNRARAVDKPARGQYAVTDVGRTLLADHPDGISERDLRTLAGDPNAPHTWYALKGHESNGSAVAIAATELDPVEQVANGIELIHAQVADELLARLHAQDPAFFEQAVLDLLIAMGYGGVDGHATRTQLSNDGGIDGVIDQDALGLGRIYVQAKRYAPASSVQRPEVQGFVGALHGQQSDQGVFITTGHFSAGARQYAETVASRVILIDGERLSRLMIRYHVGVQVKQTLDIVEIDEDFFE